MTDIGWFLVVFAMILGLLALIKGFSLLTQWIEDRPERAARVAATIRRTPGVNRYVTTQPPPFGLTSSSEEWDDEECAVHPAPAPRTAPGAHPVHSLRTPATDGAAGAPVAGLDLSPDELIAVQKMLYAWRRETAFGRTLSKTDAIKAGWGVGRSGSNPRYQRASEIYDALLGEPEPAVKYPTLMEQRQN